MQYRAFGNAGWQVSALGFGCMRLPTYDNNPMSGNVDEEETIKMVRYAIDRGVNFVDTAYLYHKGSSEVALGKALQEGYRDKVKVSDKSPVSKIKDKGDFERYLYKQLERLQVDFLDYYLLHGLNRDRWLNIVGRFNLLDEAEKAKQEGLIKHLGFSFHDSYPAFQEIVDGYDGWEMCLVQYNYLDLETQAGAAGVRYAAQRGIPVAVMEPLQGGNLAFPPEPIKKMLYQAAPGRPAYDWALQWLWDQREVAVVLSGMSTMEQVVLNLDAAEKSAVGSLTGEERRFLEETIYHKFKEIILIPCTRCYYCMPCPQEINIPFNIYLFNSGYIYGDVQNRRKQYGIFGNDASECIQCGECEDKCPQQFGVSEWMHRIHQVLGEKQPY